MSSEKCRLCSVPKFPSLSYALMNCSSLTVFLYRLVTFLCLHLRVCCCCCCSAWCAGGDRQGKAASKQPADSHPNQGTISGTSDSTQPRKEAVRSLAARVTQNTHECTSSTSVRVKILSYKCSLIVHILT